MRNRLRHPYGAGAPLYNCLALLIVVRPPSEDTCPTKDGVPAIASGSKVKKKDVPSISSSWDKIAALLKVIPCFTTPELPASDVEEFFLFSQCHFVNLGGIPCMAGVVRSSHVSPDSVFRCTYPLRKRRQKWLALFFFCPSLLNCSDYNIYFIVVSGGGFYS